jgi:16S rRNA C1402 N4-methylase RsmH
MTCAQNTDRVEIRGIIDKTIDTKTFTLKSKERIHNGQRSHQAVQLHVDRSLERLEPVLEMF